VENVRVLRSPVGYLEQGDDELRGRAEEAVGTVDI